MSLCLVPITFADACGFIADWHRHHRPPVGHKFSVGVADAAGALRGVIVVGRPVARMLQDGATPAALGYRRLITYTQAGESGASLRAAGWRVVAERPAREGWTTPSRPRSDRGVDGVARTLWEAS